MRRHIHFPGVIVTFSFALIFLNVPFSAGQDVPAAATAENDAELILPAPLKISVNVNEVRLDVVVLDRRGEPVTDLTADDFEVFQNGVRQKVLSSIYVKNQSYNSLQPTVSRQGTGNLSPTPATDLKREDTHRTIVFIVDDLSMGFENHNHTRMSLRNFVEKQMEPGDMVAILRTGRGNSALQMFLSDKRELLVRIDAMRLETALTNNLDNSDFYHIYDNQLIALSYSLRALEDMPGRKILNMLTAQTTISVPSTEIMPVGVEEIDFSVYRERFNRLADVALRSGVVVNFLNVDGLNRQLVRNMSEGGPAGAYITLGADASMPNPHSDMFGYLAFQQMAKKEVRKSDSVRDIRNPLPAKTGGLLIENSNFFLEGTGKDVDNLMKGYYLVSYEPPAGTFSSPDKETAKVIFNQIKVNVKRRNMQVHTRDGFYNRLENENTTGAPAVHPLQNAIFSPFLYSDLNVNIAAGYVRDVKAGYLVRSWIHLDPKDVTITETENGGARIDIETVCLTSDISGNVHDFVHAQYTFSVDQEKKSNSLPWIRKHGIRFAMLLPIKKPGSYYVRVATQDKESGKVGSAYQYVEIPDLDRKRLALSNIFMITGTDDLNWLLSDVTEEVFSPVFQAEEVRSPALRAYTIGDRLQALAMIYNADDKAVADAEIELQTILYKDGDEFVRIEPKPVSPAVAGNLEGIPIWQALTGGFDLPPGDYLLQLVVTDKKNNRKQEGTASQTLSFTIMEK